MAETIKAAAIAANNPFTSLSQLRKRLGEVFPFTLSRELLRVVIIKKQGLSKKKAKFFSKPTNLEAVTDAFLKKRDQLIADGRTFVSIDETSFGRHGAEVRGYAPVGKPLVIKRARPRITTVSSHLQQSHETRSYNARKWRDPSIKSASSTSSKIYHCHTRPDLTTQGSGGIHSIGESGS